MNFRTLGILYEEPTRKLSMLYEEAADTKGAWIGTTELEYWNTGARVTDLEKREVLARLNDWGRERGWTFDMGVKLLDVRLEDVPEKDREFFRMLQGAARKQIEERQKIYGREK